MKVIIIVTLVAFGSTLLSSCEKLLLKPNGTNTPKENFEFMWNELDQGYVYFDFKNIDWDSIKTVYQPLVFDSMSDDELFEVLAEMLETLKDGHNTIRQNIHNTRSFDFTNGHQINFNKEFVIEKYLVPNDMDTTTWIRHCFLNDDIGYLYYSTFTNEISKKGMDQILTKYRDTKGLIIDVRGNNGGDASNISKIMAHFVTDPTLVGYVQKKAGPGRNELKKPKEVRISPSGLLYSKPVVVLANRQAFSAANAFIGYMSTLSNVTIMGDLSGGGGGFPVANQLYNGWFFTYSSTIGNLPNGFNIEDGIEPDIRVETNEVYEAMGVDNIIEQALIQLQ